MIKFYQKLFRTKLDTGDSWESALKQPLTFLARARVIVIVIIWLTSRPSRGRWFRQYLLVIFKANISNKALWIGTGSTKQEERRVNYHLNGEKLPFLFQYQKYIDFAQLLRSNVKTVHRQGKKKLFVDREQTMGAQTSKALGGVTFQE